MEHLVLLALVPLAEACCSGPEILELQTPKPTSAPLNKLGYEGSLLASSSVSGETRTLSLLNSRGKSWGVYADASPCRAAIHGWSLDFRA